MQINAFKCVQCSIKLTGFKVRCDLRGKKRVKRVSAKSHIYACKSNTLNSALNSAPNV